MKTVLTHTRWPPARLALLCGLAFVLVAAAAVPMLAPGWRHLLMEAFSPFCHQLPERSFALAGHQTALCHRCMAVFAGLAAGLLAPMYPRATWPPLAVAAVALAPLAVDWSVDVIGLWSNTAASRVGTGLWAGGVFGLHLLGSLLRPRSPRAGEST
jgi:uncharacterized membrane protein